MRSTTVATVLAGTLAATLATTLAVTLVAVAPATTAAPAAAAPASTAPPAFPVQPVSWGRCDDPDLRQSGAECGRLTVPLDHADPGGRTIELAVARVRHTRKPFRGAVFTNPGGPGSGGTWLASYGQYVPRKVGLTYDWYGIDPRGTGASSPILTCDRGYFGWDRPDYVPEAGSAKRTFRQWRARTERYAADCGKAAGRELLDHVRTTDTAADFDLLRQAIGLEEITILGFSYGTYLAQVYATLYPDHVQALVMDGVIDPDRVFYRSNLDQDRAFQTAIRAFFGWVGRYPRVYGLGSSRAAVEQRYQRLRERLERRPAGGKVGPDELDDALLNAAYYNGYYPQVAAALSALAERGRPAGIKQLYRSSNPTGPAADNSYAMYLATQCTDAVWPTRWRTWRRDNERMHRRAPFLTWGNAWFNAPCRTWPVAGTPRVKVTGAGLDGVPVLLLSETRDPATPYSGALAARRIFPDSALVAGVGGHSHAVSLSGIACTDDTIADVLEDGTLPRRKAGSRADKECRPLAAPKPPRKGSRTAPPQHRTWWGR